MRAEKLNAGEPRRSRRALRNSSRIIATYSRWTRLRAPKTTLAGFFGINALPRTNSDGPKKRPLQDLEPAIRTKNTNGTGTSKSALATKNNRDAIQSGVLTVETADPAKLARWKTKLVSTDPKVQFHPTDLLEARHSVCGEYVRMGAVYEAARWNLHLKSNCPVLHPENRKREEKGKHQNVERWPTRGASKAPVLTTNTAIPHLPTYLQRTGAAGGSGRSLTRIAKQKFGKLFGLLTIKGKKDVTDTQFHEHRWRNDHSNFECSAVLALKNFKEAIRRPTPDDKHYIYVNDKYRNQLLGHIYARAIGLKEIIETSMRLLGEVLTTVQSWFWDIKSRDANSQKNLVPRWVLASLYPLLSNILERKVLRCDRNHFYAYLCNK
ncbi:hypothetical protein B0H13DRAFT_1850975 [Mycena leptocephala]|nr:hypothetical protein B0H13DRAFT_1850975 [Mycena leptocephala]